LGFLLVSSGRPTLIAVNALHQTTVTLTVGLFHAALQPVKMHAKMMVLVQFGVEEVAQLQDHLRGQPQHQLQKVEV
jgi:hypothetical protein